MLVQGAPALLTVEQRDRFRDRFGPASVSVSGDGRFLAFHSYARLVDADRDAAADIYLLDRATGKTRLESVERDGEPPRGDCTQPRISADGRWVVFEAALGDGDPAGEIRADILLRDVAAGTTTRLSRTPAGQPANGRSATPTINADGGSVAFASSATDLVVAEDANGQGQDVYLWRAASGQVERVSLDARHAQSGAGASFAPSISADGRAVAFVSTAPLDGALASPASAAEPGRPAARVFVRNLAAKTTVAIVRAPDGGPALGASWGPSINADGRVVAFVSDAPNLVEQDRNDAADVFLYDATSDRIRSVSTRAGGGTPNHSSGLPVVSADGRFVAFQSVASDIACARRCSDAQIDLNLVGDVFLFDGSSGVTSWVSRGASSGWLEESGGPAIDHSGEVVAFSSRHPVDADDTRGDFDLFLSVDPSRAPLGQASPRIGTVAGTLVSPAARVPPRMPPHTRRGSATIGIPCLIQNRSSVRCVKS